MIKKISARTYFYNYLSLSNSQDLSFNELLTYSWNVQSWDFLSAHAILLNYKNIDLCNKQTDFES
jgi:hypothetical protein